MNPGIELHKTINAAKELMKSIVDLPSSQKVKIEKALLLIDNLNAKAEKMEQENRALVIESNRINKELTRFVKLFDASPMPQMIVNRQGDVKRVNKSICRIFGRSQREMAGNSFLNFINPSFYSVLRNSLQYVLDNQQEHTCELKVNIRDAGQLWIQVISEPHYTGTFDEELIHSVIHNITASKTREAELLLFSAAFEQSANSILITDTNGIIQYANPRFFETTGFEPAEVLGQNPRMLKHENSVIKYGDMWQAISGGKTWSGEFLNKTKSGKPFWEIVTITPVKDAQGNIINYLAIKEDITLRKEAETNLANSEQKFRALFDRSHDAILILDGANIVDCNLKAGVLFQTSCSKIQSAKLFDFCPEKQYNGEGSQALISEQMKTALEGSPVTANMLFLHGGNAFDAEVSFTRIFINHKAKIQAIIRDVSEKRLAEKQIMNAKEDAEKARKAQSEFLSLMSHEIRTPLNAVVSLTDLLLQEDLSLEQLENLQSVKVSSRHLLSIIDDILDYNKIESGNIQFESHNFDIRQNVNELHQALKVKAKEKNVKFSVCVDNSVPEIVIGDALRLKQVLFNLLSNGIKFTERGFVSLKVKALGGEIKGKIQFEVEDTGIGIKKDRLEAIFEKFTQAETSTTRKYGGSGLGLTVSKKLIELQGGEIFARSKPGKGSVFTFFLYLPKGVGRIESQNGYAETSGSGTLQGMRILLVEDDKMNQFVGKKILEGKGGASLTVASTGEQALNILQNHEFDMILMDLLLPYIDGYQLTRIIRNNEAGQIKNPKVPIIALTADAFLETKRKAFEAGVDDFVTKPFDFIKLFNRIIKYRPD